MCYHGAINGFNDLKQCDCRCILGQEEAAAWSALGQTNALVSALRGDKVLPVKFDKK
jgi:hypothetical protein